MMRGIWLAVLLPAGLWGQAAPLPPLELPKNPAAAKKAAAAAPGAAKAPVYPPLRPVQLPKLAPVQLPNGLKLYLVEDHELPMVHGYLIVRTGSAFDPADKAGLARLTLDLLRNGGTGKATPEQCDAQLDRLGAVVDTTLTPTTSGLVFSVPRAGAGELLQLLQTMLVEPAFRAEKLEVAKVLRRGALQQQANSRSAAVHYFPAAVYGPDSPYGRLETGASVERVRRSDITAFYGRYYFPANTALAVAGDFDPAAMRASVEKLFGGWSAAGGGAIEIPRAEAAAGKAYVVQARNVLRVSFVLGQLGTELRNEDTAAWEVLVNVLGGTRHSRLLANVRSPVPGDSVEILAQAEPRYDHRGTINISVSCAAAAFPKVLDTILSEIQVLHNAPVTEEEVRVAKDAALARLAEGADTKSKRLAVALSVATAGYPDDFTAHYQAALAAVTHSDVEKLAKTLDPARFTIAAVGEAEDLRRQLAATGRTAASLDPPAAEEKLLETAAPEAGALERGRRLMVRAQDASGGSDKVAVLQDATRVADIDIGALGGGGQQTVTEMWVAPSDYRQESNTTRFVIYTNGKGGWLTDGLRSGPLTGAIYEQVHAELFRFYPRLLLGDKVLGRLVYAVDENLVEIRDGGRRLRMAFDNAGLPSEIVYNLTSTTGLPIVAEEVFEDFRDVGGIKLPFRIRILHNGQAAAVVKVKEQKVNSGLKVEDLTKHP